MDLNGNVARNLKEIRRVLDLTQQNLSDRSGVSLRQIQNIEAASGDVKLSTVAKLCRSLNIETEILLSSSRQVSKIAYQCFKAINDKHAVPIQISGADGLVIYINPACEEIQGYRSEEVCGGNFYVWDFLYDEGDKQDLKNYFNYLIKEKPTPSPYIAKNRKKDGSLINVNIEWDYIFDRDKNIIGFYSKIHPRH